jgi:hypothetical protein
MKGGNRFGQFGPPGDNLSCPAAGELAMNFPNGPANGAVAREDHTHQSDSALLGSVPAGQFAPEQIKQFVALLEVPFDPLVIEWRVTNTSKAKVNGSLRGQVIPYADQRAYTDRLNALFSPAGWTRKYTVHTSANFQREKDQKTTAKVFVTCELTIFGIGSHSATGEEWTDDENAGTAAEAQAFKRACACFGLGRYLYHFSGTWVDLDDRKRPKTTPRLVGWATPEGWRQGLRPSNGGNKPQSSTGAATVQPSQDRQNTKNCGGDQAELIRQIESMARPLGRGLYRGLLKAVRAWNPSDIKDASLLGRLLAQMQVADLGLRRLEAALEKTGLEALAAVLQSMGVRSLNHLDSLETLHKIVLTLEAKAAIDSQP